MKKLFVLLVFISVSIFAQSKSAKAQFEVDGVCGMCKVRIEKAAIKTKGVKMATWDVDSHIITIIYDQNKTSLEEIQANIAAVGHDTDLSKASIYDYEQLDACCKYKDPEVVKDHQ